MKRYVRLLGTIVVAMIAVHASAQQWSVVADLATPRMWHQAVVLHDGRIMVLGGITGATRFMDGNSLDGMSTDACEIFDPRTGALFPAASMPVPRSEFPAVVGPDGKVYVFGGLIAESQAGRCTNTIDAYDPATDTWTTVGRMRSTRRRHAAVMIDDRRVLICGGGQENRITYGESEIFDIVTHTTVTTASMPEQMKEGTLGLIDGGVPCYVGGRQAGGNSPRQSGIFLFDTENLVWYVTPLPAGMPGIVSGTVVGSSIVTCGGNLGEIPYRFSPAVYMINDGQARHVVDMEEGRSLHAMRPIGGRTVLVSGGIKENYGTLASTLAIDVDGGGIVIKPSHVISRAYHELIRYQHPRQGLTYYAVSGLTNTRSPDSTEPGPVWDDRGDDGRNNPMLTPTIEMLTIGSEAILLHASSVAAHDGVDVRVYPNPATDRVQVSAAAGAVVTIIDVGGRTVASGVVGTDGLMLDVAAFPAGAYLVGIATPSAHVMRPLLKR